MNYLTYVKPSTIGSSWRLFSFTPENLTAETNKGNNEYTKLNQIRICNHLIALLSFVWRVFLSLRERRVAAWLWFPCLYNIILASDRQPAFYLFPGISYINHGIIPRILFRNSNQIPKSGTWQQSKKHSIISLQWVPLSSALSVLPFIPGKYIVNVLRSQITTIKDGVTDSNTMSGCFFPYLGETYRNGTFHM